jgi:hypothetical protein
VRVELGSSLISLIFFLEKIGRNRLGQINLDDDFI